MTLRDDTPLIEQEPLGILLGRLVDDGREVARAEIELYKSVARDRASRSMSAFVFLAVALLLAIAGTVMMLISLAHGLARFIGPGWGALASGVIGFAVAGLLAKLAATRLSAAFSGKDAA